MIKKVQGNLNGILKRNKFVIQTNSLVLAIFFAITNLYGQNFIFDKHKWKKSSDYRFEVANSSDFSKFLKGKSKDEIIKLLGLPLFVSRGSFTYSLVARGYFLRKRNGSMISIEFDKNNISSDVIDTWAN